MAYYTRSTGGADDRSGSSEDEREEGQGELKSSIQRMVREAFTEELMRAIKPSVSRQEGECSTANEASRNQTPGINIGILPIYGMTGYPELGGPHFEVRLAVHGYSLSV